MGETMLVTYKPSKKVSFMFLPIYIAVLILLVPLTSLCYVSLVLNKNSILWNIFVYIVCFVLLPYCLHKWCIRVGKVRNKQIAFWAGFFIFLAFSYSCLAYYQILSNTKLDTWHILQLTFKDCLRIQKDFLALLLQPDKVFYILQSIIPSGILNKMLFFILCIVEFLLLLFYLIFYFIDGAKEPFCEETGKWSKKLTFSAAYIQNSKSMLDKLLSGNFTILTQLELLKKEQDNYCEVELFVTDGEYFYITLKNNNKENSKKETIVELLQIDKQIGWTLLSRVREEEDKDLLRVRNKKMVRKRLSILMWKTIFFILQIGLILFSVSKIEWKLEFSFSGLIPYYCVIQLFLSLIGMYHCFAKEEIIIEKPIFTLSDISAPYQIEEENPSIIERFYYLFMTISSSYLLWYIINF